MYNVRTAIHDGSINSPFHKDKKCDASMQIAAASYLQWKPRREKSILLEVKIDSICLYVYFIVFAGIAMAVKAIGKNESQ